MPIRAAKPPLVAACDSAIGRIFRIEGEDVALWSNVFITYMMGNMAFGALLGTSDEESSRSVEMLAAVVETAPRPADHRRPRDRRPRALRNPGCGTGSMGQESGSDQG